MRRRLFSKPRFGLAATLAVLIASAGAPAAQSPTDEAASNPSPTTTAVQVQKLRKQVRTLRRRVATLERQVAALSSAPRHKETTGPPGSDASSQPLQRYGYVDQVRTIQPKVSEKQRSRLKQLQSDVERLRQQVIQAQRQVGNAGNQATSINTADNQTRAERNRELNQKIRRSRKQTQDEAAVLRRYQKQLRKKQAKLTTLRQKTRARKVIEAHRGKLKLILEAAPDQPTGLTYKPRWRVITWTGKLKSAQGNTQHWMVSDVRPVGPSAGQTPTGSPEATWDTWREPAAPRSPQSLRRSGRRRQNTDQPTTSGQGRSLGTSRLRKNRQ